MRSKARSAFTLIEVLVVIGITSLLAGLILSYSSNSRDQVALYVEQAKLSQTIARAKSLTVSTYNDPLIPCGYGIHIDHDDGSYKLFSYGIEEGSEDPPQCDNIESLDPNLQIDITNEQLPPNLVFEEPDAESIVDILFLPPDPATWIWLHGGNGTSTLGRIQIKARSGPNTQSISVSSAGQISF